MRILCFFALFLLSAGVTAQICRTDQERRTPTSDFTLLNDGTTSQNTTDLMWMRCPLGQTYNNDRCTGRADNLTWDQSVAAADRSSFAGHNDWRLPTMRELSGILDQACRSPSINLDVFPDASSSWYWTSTNYAYDRSLKWGIYFDLGYQDYTGSFHPSHVRLVRNR